MTLWQKVVFYLVSAGVLILAACLFAVLTLSTAHYYNAEKWILGTLCVAVILFTILVWKRGRWALVPAISADILFSLWFVFFVFDWQEGYDAFLELFVMSAYALSGLMAAIVLALLGPKHCGPYFPLKS